MVLKYKGREKEYKKIYMKEYKQTHKEKLREIDIKRSQTTKRKKWQKKYLQKLKSKGYFKKYENRLEVKVMRKEYRKKNKEKIKKHSQKLEIIQHRKEYREKNLEKYRQYMEEYSKNYNKKNRLKIRERQNKYCKERKKYDKLFLISCRLRCLVKRVIDYYSKTGKIMSSKEYGINYKAIIEHLKPFPKDFLSKEYHIHHIIPLHLFNFDDLEQIKLAFAPENHILLAKEQHKAIHTNEQKYILKLLMLGLGMFNIKQKLKEIGVENIIKIK